MDKTPQSGPKFHGKCHANRKSLVTMGIEFTFNVETLEPTFLRKRHANGKSKLNQLKLGT